MYNAQQGVIVAIVIIINGHKQNKSDIVIIIKYVLKVDEISITCGLFKKSLLMHGDK